MDKDLSVDTRKHAHTHTLWLILSPLFMLHPVYWGLFFRLSTICWSHSKKLLYNLWQSLICWHYKKNITNVPFVKTGSSQSSLVLYFCTVLGYLVLKGKVLPKMKMLSLIPSYPHAIPILCGFCTYTEVFPSMQPKKAEIRLSKKKDKVTPSDQFLKKAEPYAVKRKARKPS